MTRGELRSKVAEAMREPPPDRLSSAEDEVIRVVLEAAAEMARDELGRFSPHRPSGFTPFQAVSNVVDRIRRAITAQPGDEL